MRQCLEPWYCDAFICREPFYYLITYELSTCRNGVFDGKVNMFFFLVFKILKKINKSIISKRRIRASYCCLSGCRVPWGRTRCMGTVVDYRSVPEPRSVQRSPCWEFASLGSVPVTGTSVPSSSKGSGLHVNLSVFPNGLQVHRKNLCRKKRKNK